MKSNFVRALAIGLVGTTVALPALAPAQSKSQLQRRQQQKNQWRNIGLGAATLGVLGALKGDRNLTLLGAAGAAYSANRYEQDRKSQNRLEDRRYGRSSRDRYRSDRYGSGRYDYDRSRDSNRRHRDDR